MKILIVGAGAVGGYFGGLLAKWRDNSAGSLDVTFLARGGHLKAIQEKGLSIKSIKGDFNIRVKAVERLTDTKEARPDNLCREILRLGRGLSKY